MAKNDELDTVLRDPRMADKDYGDLYEVLAIKTGVPRLQRTVFINQQIRHAYGHSIPNIFREWYDPDYIDIIRGTAKRLKIQVKDHSTLDELEDKILLEIIEIAREQIIKEKGEQAWKNIEKDVEDELSRLIDEGKIPKPVAEDLRKLRGAALMAALFGGRLAGFALYIVANQVFFAVARGLGLRIGVAIAGPIIGRVLAFLLGPAGWVLSAVLLVFDLGNTDWRKVIPAIVMVISLRRRFKYGDDGPDAVPA